MLTLHLQFYVAALSALFPADRLRFRLTRFADSAPAERLDDTVLPALNPLPGNVELVEDPRRERGRGYYRDIAVRIDLLRDGVELEIGDGGLTDWTGSLLSDRKERCLTTCVATERLASLRTPIDT
jgi:hypothetical protein